ncbi:hypothetical protein HMPREF0973_02948 [Prevotella veroralis F0319]|uniref:Uncharacterized protein n=1 Tax=Prevotella veroralis F0319 TaxID=649761 RepID=C9MTH2_9BACT|nr:hypothetical protein HMPREF0973_02948 [Prevotella veroralis F0319]
MDVVPQSRDRRPRLSAQHSTLHYKQTPLCGQTRASVPTILLCLSYFVTLSSLLIMLSLVGKNRWNENKETPFSVREGRSFVSKKASPCNEETPSYIECHPTA